MLSEVELRKAEAKSLMAIRVLPRGREDRKSFHAWCKKDTKLEDLMVEIVSSNFGNKWHVSQKKFYLGFFRRPDETFGRLKERLSLEQLGINHEDILIIDYTP